MKLLKLKLENFQGIRSLEIEPNGESISIYGDNATGKTTVFNALTWLLFDKAATGAKGFTPKTRGSDGELHNLEHSASAIFEIEDGSRVTIKKSFHEVYKKKHGSASEEFSGHTVDYFIDGVPAKEKEYTAAILRFCGGDPELPKLLTMPDYFPEVLGWEERRRILLDICGNVTDEEILNSTEELSALIPLLLKEGTTDQRYTIDEYKKIAAARRSDINKRLESIPARIDEAQKAIPDLEGIVEENVDKEIARLDGEIRAAEFERSTSAPADHTAAIRQEISRLEVLFSEKKADYQKDINLKNEKISSELNLARSEARTALQEVSKIKNELWEANRAHDKLVALREQLIQEFQEAQRLTFPESSTICPTCAQPLPAEKVAQMRSEFNLRKSKRLEEINRRGKTEANKETIAAMVEKRDQLASQVPILEAEYQRLTQRADDLSKQIYSPPPYDMTDEGRKIRADINELEKALANPSVSPEMQAADEKINALRAEMRVAQEQKMKLALAKTQLARIAELEEEEKRLGTEFEGIEYGIYLCSLFTRAKVARLTERINSKFKTVRFRLFEEQINGGLKEGCEVMIPGADGRMVPYSYANNAARINAGLEIIGILSAHTGVKMPVVVDNAESVTRMISTDSQLIRLVVSAEDQKLRVEYGC